MKLFVTLLVIILGSVAPVAAQELSAKELLTIISCKDTACIAREMAGKKAATTYAAGVAFRVDERGIVLNYVVDDASVADKIKAGLKQEGFEKAPMNGKQGDEYTSARHPGIIWRMLEDKNKGIPLYDFELWRSIWEEK